MLGKTSPTDHFLTSVLPFISDNWYMPAVLMVFVIVGFYAFFRSRRGARVQGLPDALKHKSGSDEASDESVERKFRPRMTTRNPETVKAGGRDSYHRNSAELDEIDRLPIGKIHGISPPTEGKPLPASDDPGLQAALDEINSDLESDVEIRHIALRVLAGFKTRNSVEALSQVALYDLSSNLRSRAVMMLATIDHESVFASIVLACADPSREVRAAAARALVKVTFDRGDEWSRIALMEDQYMSRQVARAAVEGGIAERSFDRLVMQDERAVYESFALVYLLIKTGETEKIFEAIRKHREVKIRLALLHAVRVANVAEVMPELSALIAAEPLGSVVADKARDTLLEINAVTVSA